MTETTSISQNEFFLNNSINHTLYEAEPEDIIFNDQFKSCKKWVTTYLGPATAILSDIKGKSHKAIKDENRNAIIPSCSIKVDGTTFYLSIKGCGAYEDMFFGGNFTKEKVKAACRDISLIKKIDSISDFSGLIMAENWMGESPYGAQGEINGFDELKFSRIAEKDSINGALICPSFAVVQMPTDVEELAKKFYWFRKYPKNFYQVLRLVPSNIRLYFESRNLMTTPGEIFKIFGINHDKQVEQFELNFIRSGLALLTLFSRSLQINGNDLKGIIYQDVWLDKDCVVAPNGNIHFTDIEGFIWKEIKINEYVDIQKKEWQKLVFEFLFALLKLDTYRKDFMGFKPTWEEQRNELALLIQLALNKDPYLYSEIINNDLVIVIDIEEVPNVKIPLMEGLN